MITATNPIIPGFHPDPSILRVGEDYFIATSTFQWFAGVQLYHSRDLVNWEALPSPLSRVSQLDMQGNPNSGGIWGPCLSYCDGIFYLVYTNTRNFHGIFKDTPNYVVTTRDIFSGEWSEPIYLNSSGFDPSMFHDIDGKKYLLNMRWDHRMEKNDFSGILMQEFDPVAGCLVGEVRQIFDGTPIGATEAPHLYRHGEYYYLMLAEGGTMYNHGVQLARSRNIWGPYEADPMPLLTTRNNPESPLQRTGHASLIDTPRGEWYVAYLSCRPITEKSRSILGRETSIAPVVWDSDGWLRLRDGGVVPPVCVDIDLDEVKYAPLPSRDCFKCDTLPHHYKSLRLPLDRIGSLSERAGYLRLYGQEAITSWNNQSLVARRLQHFDAQATTRVEFDPKTFQQMAGLTVIYDTYNFFYLYMSRDEESGENCLRIIVRDNLKFYNPIEGGRVLIGDAKSVYLRAHIHGLLLDFSYSLDGKEFTPLASDLDASDLSDEAYGEIGHEGHTGTFVGMACQDLSGLRACADFEFFEYIQGDEK